jgi:hypothetical protein
MGKWLVIMLCLWSFAIGLHVGGYIAYKRGRIDKHAEIMQKLTGDSKARIAVMTQDKLTYHPAGICVTCHGS